MVAWFGGGIVGWSLTIYTVLSVIVTTRQILITFENTFRRQS
jgi:hypothetical protein